MSEMTNVCLNQSNCNHSVRGRGYTSVHFVRLPSLRLSYLALGNHAHWPLTDALAEEVLRKIDFALDLVSD